MEETGVNMEETGVNMEENGAICGRKWSECGKIKKQRFPLFSILIVEIDVILFFH